MVRKLLITLIICLFVSPVWAHPKPPHSHDHSHADDNESFDVGAYLDLVLWENKDKTIQIGNKNSYEFQRGEFTSLVGATYRVDSLFKR